MKRWISYILIVAILFSVSSVCISAVEHHVLSANNADNTSWDSVAGKEETASDEMYQTDNGVDFSCVLNGNDATISLRGSVNHDILNRYHDYTLEIYSLLPGDGVEEKIQNSEVLPVASASIAIKFQFSISAKTVEARYSRYCVVLCSPDRSQILIYPPKYAEVPSDFDYDADSRPYYKGVATNDVAAASRAGAGQILIPVYLDKLLCETSDGYMVPLQGENVFFERAYVDRLDLLVRTAYISGSKVYFQFLMSEAGGVLGGEWGERMGYRMPDTYSLQTLLKLEAITGFFTQRYAQPQSGRLHGIIVGSKIDQPLLTEGGTLISMEEYVQRYMTYLLVIAGASRRYQADMDIVLPFSSQNTYAVGVSAERGYTSSELLECLLQELDRGSENGFLCTAMIETEESPYVLPDSVHGEEIIFQQKNDDRLLHAGNVETYADYLKILGATYQSAPLDFMLVWNVPFGLRSNLLNALYTYSYFRLISEDLLSSFVISFLEEEANGANPFADAEHIFDAIDTKDSLQVTKNLLPYFGLEQWADIHTSEFLDSYALRTLYQGRVSQRIPSKAQGSFSYFDFSTSVNLNMWFSGVSCQGIRLDYSGRGGKALKMSMTGVSDGYAEAFYLYDYPENFTYTPYVAFQMQIEAGGKGDSKALYEIVISTGTERTQAVFKSVVDAGERALMVLDMSDFNAEHMAEYWRIGVRALNGETDDISLWIYDVVGYSEEHDSLALEHLIEAERLKIRNATETEEDGADQNDRLWSIVVISVFILTIGFGIFLCIRSNDDKKRVPRQKKE